MDVKKIKTTGMPRLLVKNVMTPAMKNGPKQKCQITPNETF